MPNLFLFENSYNFNSKNNFDFFLRWKFGRIVKSSFERQRPDFRKSSKETLQKLQSGSRIVQRQMLLELELTVQKMFIVIVI